MGLINSKIINIFYIFVIAHLIIWTAIPSLTNNNLPLDTIEALAWGSNLDWGFNKHPPMSAFLAEIFYQIFGTRDWAYYLLSQICVIISFFVVFKLSEEFFKNKKFCLISILLLEGIFFYNFTTPEFNVNICLMPFWSLTVYFLWKGIKNNNFIDWFLLGLFSGFAFLSKYLFIYLGLAIDVLLIYMIIKKKIDYKCLIAFVPFLIILCPHLVWLTENNYITIIYGLDRTGTGTGYQSYLDHIIHPLIFLGKQIGILVPFLLMLLFLIEKFKNNLNLMDDKFLFLLAINILPILLVFLTSVIMGIKIRTMWMSPFYLFLGVFLIYIFQSQINLNKLTNFVNIFMILFLISPFSYAYISISQKDKRTDYKGKEEAKAVMIAVENDFMRIKNKTIKYIWGNEWVAGNLSYHLKDRPRWMGSDLPDVNAFNPDYLCFSQKGICIGYEKKND